MCNKFKEKILNFYYDIARDKRYWMPLLFLSVLSYGFSMFNRTLSIDDLVAYVGKGSGMIMSMRWGLSFWANFFSTLNNSPFIDKFVGVALMFIGLTLINAFFYETTRNNKYMAVFNFCLSCLNLPSY